MDYTLSSEAENAEQDRLLETLEHLLSIEAVELEEALSQAADSIAHALNAEKIDVFLYDDSLKEIVALGVSRTSMGEKQKALKLNHVPLENGGRSAEVFLTGDSYLSGRVDEDAGEIAGVKTELGIRSSIIVPLMVNQQRQGVVQAASSHPDFFVEKDLQFLQAVAHWLGLIAHRGQLVEQVELEALQRGRRLAAEELMTILAHDLKNYLTPLKGRLGMMRIRAEREARERDSQDLVGAEQALKRFERMISRLLDVARLKQGMLTLEYQMFDLAELLREIVTALSASLENVTLNVPEHYAIQADRERVQQALENLTANALKHTPEKTPVFLKLETVEDEERSFWAQVTIRDQGPGIPPELIDNLFQPFQTGGASTGLGLGLYLAHNVALAHGGALVVDETFKGGASFIFTLPLEHL